MAKTSENILRAHYPRRSGSPCEFIHSDIRVVAYSSPFCLDDSDCIEFFLEQACTTTSAEEAPGLGTYRMVGGSLHFL
jgi:hypothetical protein